MASAAWYQRLGFEFEFLHRVGDGSPLLVAICSGDARILLSEHVGDAKQDGLVYLRVEDLNEAARMIGVSAEMPGWGTLEAHAVDPAGNRVRIAQAWPVPSQRIEAGISSPIGVRSRWHLRFALRYDGGYSSSENGVEYPVVLRNESQVKAWDVTLRSLHDGVETDSKVIRELDPGSETARAFMRIPAELCQLRPGRSGRVPRGHVSFEAWHKGRRVALQRIDSELVSG